MLSKIIKWLNGENYNAKAARELAANPYIYLASDLPGATEYNKVIDEALKTLAGIDGSSLKNTHTPQAIELDNLLNDGIYMHELLNTHREADRIYPNWKSGIQKHQKELEKAMK